VINEDVMKKLLYKLLIDRAAPVVVQWTGKVIQNAAVAAGTYFAAHGIQAGDKITLIAGGATAAVGLLIDAARIIWGDSTNGSK
jgi:hypothetical protein